MQPHQGRLKVVSDVLVELIVLLVLDLASVAGPDGLERVQSASIELDGHRDEAGIPLDDALKVGLAIRDGFLAANRNLDEVDPRCGKLAYVRETTPAKPRLIMTNNFAFGGINTSLVFRRV